MYDGGSLSEPGQLQRAVGDLRIVAKRFGSETVLDDLRQAGCLKAKFPKRIVAGWMDVLMLNTGGGVAGGDRLDIAIKAGTGARTTIAAQAAERFYRVLDANAPSRVRTRLTAEPGACLEWLPQEAIVFDRFALDRRLEVQLAADASFLGVETIVFGRAAMGERVRQGRLRDVIRVQRSDELLLHDAVRLDGDVDALLTRPAVGAGARAITTIVSVAPDVETKLNALRTAFGQSEAGASVWNGMLVARILGADGAVVRRLVIAALHILRDARPLPRAWSC